MSCGAKGFWAMSRLRAMALAALALLAFVETAAAAELLMFRRAGCPWCRAWDEKVGPIYETTDIGRQAPIRMVDLDRDSMPTIALVRPVRHTPTFILADDGREIGRIEGYPGEDFFWGLLENLVQKLPAGS
jgi:thioredoxin-related protein